MRHHPAHRSSHTRVPGFPGRKPLWSQRALGSPRPASEPSSPLVPPGAAHTAGRGSSAVPGLSKETSSGGSPSRRLDAGGNRKAGPALPSPETPGGYGLGRCVRGAPSPECAGSAITSRWEAERLPRCPELVFLQHPPPRPGEGGHHLVPAAHTQSRPLRGGPAPRNPQHCTALGRPSHLRDRERKGRGTLRAGLRLSPHTATH